MTLIHSSQSETIPGQKYLGNLPLDLWLLIGLKLSAEDLNRWGRVSRLFNQIANHPHLWNQVCLKWKIPLLDENLHPKQVARAYFESDYAYVRLIVGALPFAAFVCIPVVSLVHTRKILADWSRQAPQSSVIRGSKWETHLHRYIPFMAFSILEYQREHTFILVKEEPERLSAEKKDYLRRLIHDEPCGIWQEEGEGGRLMRKRGEIQENKRAKSLCSVVKLVLPSFDHGFRVPFKYF